MSMYDVYDDELAKKRQRSGKRTVLVSLMFSAATAVVTWQSNQPFDVKMVIFGGILLFLGAAIFAGRMEMKKGGQYGSQN